MAQTKGEHGTCSTVLIKGADGEPTMINKDDFDPKEHTLHKAATAEIAKAAKASHKGETKAERKARLAEEKQAKKDAKDAASDDLDGGESTGE